LTAALPIMIVPIFDFKRLRSRRILAITGKAETAKAAASTPINPAGATPSGI